VRSNELLQFGACVYIYISIKCLKTYYESNFVFLQLSKLVVPNAPAIQVVIHAMGRPAVAPVAVLLEQGSIDRSVIRGGHGPCSWDRRTRRRTWCCSPLSIT
jgi:hypothetical protein